MTEQTAEESAQTISTIAKMLGISDKLEEG